MKKKLETNQSKATLIENFFFIFDQEVFKHRRCI